MDQLCAMLGGIGKKTAYDLLRSGEIRCIKTRLESLSTLVAWAQQFLHDRKYLCASGYGGKRILRCEADRRTSHPGQRSDQHLVLAPVLSGRRELAREQGNTRLPEIRETEYFQVSFVDKKDTVRWPLRCNGHYNFCSIRKSKYFLLVRS